jgi:hypothetical protein
MKIILSIPRTVSMAVNVNNDVKFEALNSNIRLQGSDNIFP